jgi:hypothetical protein
MKFQESGLPKNKLLEEAFNYSYANVMSYTKEAMEDFTQQIGESHAQNLEALNAAKAAGNMSDEEYQREKKELEKMRDAQLKMGPPMIEKELNRMFKQRRLAPALEILKNSDKSSMELMAAVMLLESVRSPKDYLHVAATFGENIAGLVAELQHIDAYSSERAANLAVAGSDTKRAYVAVIISSLDQIVAQFQQMAKLNPQHKIMFHPGQEEEIYGNIKPLWGNDKKLDQRFVAAFNRTAETTSSSFRMEVNGSGELELIKNNLKPPSNNTGPKPTGPGGKDGLGDPVF